MPDTNSSGSGGTALAEQHATWAAAQDRLWFSQPPPPRPKRPRPVSPFVREARDRRKAQRKAFEAQMLEPAAAVELPYVDCGWPPYRPVAPYDECSPARRHPITMREIIAEVARKHGVSVNDIISVRRPRPVVAARHEAMWRCKEETSFSLPQIGRALGGKDHTTVLHGVRMHEKRMEEARNPVVHGEPKTRNLLVPDSCAVSIEDRHSNSETVNG